LRFSSELKKFKYKSHFLYTQLIISVD